MLEVAPEAVAELAEIKPGAELPRPPRSRRRSTASAASASGSAPSTACRGGAARGRGSARHAIRERDTWSRRSSGCGRASRLNREARERLLAFEVVNAHSSGCSPNCSGATADSSSSSTRTRSKPASKSGKRPTNAADAGRRLKALPARIAFAVFLTNLAPSACSTG